MSNNEEKFEEDFEEDFEENLDGLFEELEELDGFGMRLAKLVDQSDLNDSQLSLFIGKNKGYINRIINGETFPTIKNFVIICRALKITPEEFFRFDDDSPAETNALILDFRKLNHVEKQHVHYIVNDIIKDRPK